MGAEVGVAEIPSRRKGTYGFVFMCELRDLRAEEPLGKAACGSVPKTVPDKGFLLRCSASPRDQAAETTVLKVGEGSSDNTELKVS